MDLPLLPNLTVPMIDGVRKPILYLKAKMRNIMDANPIFSKSTQTDTIYLVGFHSANTSVRMDISYFRTYC